MDPQTVRCYNENAEFFFALYSSGKSGVEKYFKIAFPLIYCLGVEQGFTEKSLEFIFNLNGRKPEAIWVGVEHRGFGQNFSFDDDQSVPDYVCLQ